MTALTTEQIELLRGLPEKSPGKPVDGNSTSDAAPKGNKPNPTANPNPSQKEDQ